MAEPPNGRLALLSTYLESDPDNELLLADAAQAAIDEGHNQTALMLIARLRDTPSGAASALGLDGKLAMNRREFEQAASIFAEAMDGRGRATAAGLHATPSSGQLRALRAA